MCKGAALVMLSPLDARGIYFLNGVATKLRGIPSPWPQGSWAEENYKAGIPSSQTDERHESAIRTTHNPASRTKRSTELGLIVQEEARYLVWWQRNNAITVVSLKGCHSPRSSEGDSGRVRSTDHGRQGQGLNPAMIWSGARKTNQTRCA